MNECDYVEEAALIIKREEVSLSLISLLIAIYVYHKRGFAFCLPSKRLLSY